MKLLKSLVIALLLIPVGAMACPQDRYCMITSPHQHQYHQQMVVVTQQPQYNVVDMVEGLVYVSGGALRIVGDYYSIQSMRNDNDYQRMWNKRYKYGLDTRANTGYGIRRYDGHGRGRGYRPVPPPNRRCRY